LSQFALPYCYDRDALLGELSRYVSITATISRDLALPKLAVTGWQRAAPAVVPVPKAAVHEDREM
jgi:hypothetical protein